MDDSIPSLCASDASGPVELVGEMLAPLGSARGSLLGRIRPLSLVMEKLVRTSPDWLLGRLRVAFVKRDAARDSREAVDSSIGVMAGE